jgi:hypothetical protein
VSTIIQCSEQKSIFCRNLFEDMTKKCCDCEMGNLENNRFMLWQSSDSIALAYNVLKALRYVNPTSIYKYMKIKQYWVWRKEHSDYLSRIINITTFFYSSSKLFKLSTENYANLFIQSPKTLRLQLEKYLAIKNV